MLSGSTPSTSAQGNAASQRIYLPQVLTPEPPVDIVRISTYGGRGGSALIIVLRNTGATSICDILVDYTVETSYNQTVAEQSTLSVVFPSETMRFPVASLDIEEEVVSYQATVLAWKSSTCRYAQLTPVSQEVIETGAYSINVTGTIRNDTATTLTNSVVILSPGSAYSLSQAATVTPTTIEPGDVATYSADMSFTLFDPDPPSSFNVRTYGSSALSR